jgi:hypothetical protein
MANWQLQCCGEPFTVGKKVEWTLAPVGDRGSLVSALGPDLAETVTHREDHHGFLLPDDAPRTVGAVRSIRAVRCRYGRTLDEAKRVHVVPGSTTVTSVRSADGRERDQDGSTFVGFIVEFDAL